MGKWISAGRTWINLMKTRCAICKQPYVVVPSE